MATGVKLGTLFFILALLGIIAASLGTPLDSPVVAPTVPQEKPGFLDAIGYVFSGVGSFFQMVAVDLPLPPEIAGAVIGALTIVILYVVFRLIRGGG